MASLDDRFEAKVDRSGPHHLWLGSRKADGTGKLKVDGTTVTAIRIAWQLANGPLPAGAAVRCCSERKDCVRIEHLSLVLPRTERRRATRQRSARGAGTKTQVGPGVWKLTVSAGRYEDGRPRRVHQHVEADEAPSAARELARFVGEVDPAILPQTVANRDITVDVGVELTYRAPGVREGARGGNDRAVPECASGVGCRCDRASAGA